MAERAVAAREQLQLSQNSDGTALQAPLDKFESILPAALLHIPAAFAIAPVRSLRFFFGGVQDRVDSPSGLTLRPNFRTKARVEVSPWAI